MCDLAVASEAARFALPGIKNGIFCTTPGVGVSRNLSRKHAMEMLLTGDLVDAQTAERWGLVNRVVPAAQLDAAVAELAHKVTAHSRAVNALGKRLFYEQIERGLADAYDVAANVMHLLQPPTAFFAPGIAFRVGRYVLAERMRGMLKPVEEPGPWPILAPS
jgi:enoyl-CoA hydratase/carnithine racemase